MLKDKIKAYQTNGDRQIIDDIMTGVEIDFLKDSSRERVKDGSRSGGIRISLRSNEQYISYRIRAMREMIMRHVTYKEYVSPVFIAEFQRYLSIIYMDLGLEFNATIYDKKFYMYYFNLTPELFNELERLMPEIEEKFPLVGYRDEEFKAFKLMFDKLRKLEDGLTEEKERTRNAINESAVRAIEYALKYVDINKSEQEIVKYINKTFSTRFSDDEIKRNGLRRIQYRVGGGKVKTTIVNPHFPSDLQEVIFGFKFQDKRDVLNAGQNEFLTTIMEIVKADAENNDTSNYWCDMDGRVQVSKKYIAEKTGVAEDTVRQKLNRIRKKLLKQQ